MLGALAVCTTYQAASGILPMLTAVLAFKMWLSGGKWKDILSFLAVAAAGYCVGILIFQLFIMRPLESGAGYVSTTTVPFERLIPETFQHLKKYFSLIHTDFDPKWFLAAGLLGPAFLWAALQQTVRGRFLTLFAAFFAALILLGMSFGLYPLLSEPLYSPRAMYGFGAALAFLAVFSVSAKKALPAKLVCLALSWFFFIFSLTYGNALFVQKSYTDFRITEVVDSLKDLDIVDHDDWEVSAQITGTIGRAPALRNMPQNYQMLNRLIPITFGDSSWVWSRQGFSNYYGLPQMVWNGPDLSELSLPVLDETIYHTIRADGQHLLIELK